MDKDSGWECVRTEPGPEIPLFDVEFRYMINPRNGHELKALALLTNDTVNIIAITTDGKVLLVKQMRFGLGKEIAELPAGFIDGDEEPLEAARRELREETGHTSKHWEQVGSSYINPAYVNNKCIHFVARDVVRTQRLDLDPSEQMEVLQIPIEELLRMVRQGEIVDAITKSSLGHVFDLR